MKKTCPWIVAHDGLEKFECLRCGEIYKMTLPCPMSVMIAAMKAFGKDHKKCKPSGGAVG